MVSGDFRAHPVGFFLESILGLIDKQTLHLTAYSTQQNRGDDLTGKLRSLFQQWRDVGQLDDPELARMIQSDNIDILIDLAGHTAFNRSTVFAWKPAPVQVSWLGYFASTGIPGMDYFLTDPVSSPAGSEQQFTETLWYLPDTRLCFSPPALTQPIPVSPPPCLHNGYITFGCFQRPSKINDEVIRLWSRILQALPESRLRLKCPSLNTAKSRETFLDHLTALGLARNRIDIEGKSSREDYLRGYSNVDMMLDTFPFPGGTTSCEALWMGVPTVTLNGETLIQRQGASLLTAAGMPDWIAETPDEYVTKAIRFAQDPELLAHIRATQRQAVEASPVMDAPRFVRHLEKALLGMWNEHAAKHPS
jgi:predicted O-linked N-acetylglucosamine transferase (SPINDLY family)